MRASRQRAGGGAAGHRVRGDAGPRRSWLCAGEGASFYNRNAGERSRRRRWMSPASRATVTQTVACVPDNVLSDPCRPCAGDRGGSGRRRPCSGVGNRDATVRHRWHPRRRQRRALTPDLAYRVGRQLVATLRAQRAATASKLVIGRDTRRSGPLLEAAMTAGVLSAGGECFAAGVLRRPESRWSPVASNADGGIVLSAPTIRSPTMGSSSFRPRARSFPTPGRTRSRPGSRAPTTRRGRAGRHRPPA